MSSDPTERLHPLVRHHIVNDLGWPGLRPVQRATIAPILDGENLVVVAPTAGGKTEAAFFPILSEVAAEPLDGLRVLYLSPIRALLNNQEARLQRYFGWLGASAACWHGDTRPAARKRIRKGPPTCLMTTPESLESILCSTLSAPEAFFRNVRWVVVDELHAFAASDRGWHLLAVLQRIAWLAGADLQRIGLSATVGNLDALRAWLSRGSHRPSRALPPPRSAADADVRVDFVGNLANAAKVVSTMHRGEKRLVFCDSRLQCEKLAAALRRRDVTTFVTHSSLSLDERQQAEAAFAEGRNCVIVATSALELGIDVGDLDRVIQIDAPSSAASFLQRMGRTGRREGTRPNCLFLATDDLNLVRAAGVVRLWQQGYVEPAEPPAFPLHLLAQQAITMLLQGRGLTLRVWRKRLGEMAAMWGLPVEQADALADHLVAADWVGTDGPHAHVGPAAEVELGRRHFIELLSVFETPDVFTVYHGDRVIGEVDGPTFWSQSESARGTAIVLAGRTWRVEAVDRRRRRAQVVPTQGGGTTRWLGGSAPVGPILATLMRSVLVGDLPAEPYLSQRARTRLDTIVEEYGWLGPDHWVLELRPDGRARLWTFAGDAVNRTLALYAQRLESVTAQADALSLTLPPLHRGWRSEGIHAWTALDPRELDFTTEPERAKFFACLPPTMQLQVAQARRADAAAWLRRETVRSVTNADP